METRTMDEIVAAVETKGAPWMDENLPGWHERVNPDLIDQGSPEPTALWRRRPERT